MNWELLEKRIAASEHAYQRPIIRKKIDELVAYYLQCADSGSLPAIPGSVLLVSDRRLEFSPSGGRGDAGTLKLPEESGILRALDGQHRLLALHQLAEKHNLKDFQVPAVVYDNLSPPALAVIIVGKVAQKPSGPPSDPPAAAALSLLLDRLPGPAVEAICEELLALSPEHRGLHLRNRRRAARPEIAERLVERSFALRKDEPGEALRMARVAVEVAEALGTAPVPPRIAAHSLAQAWGNVGNCLRILGDLRAAERAWRKAEGFLALGSGDAKLAADLLRLKAALRRDQRRFPEANELLAEVHDLYRELGDGHLAGRTRVSQAVLHSQAGRLRDAYAYLLEGGREIDPERDPALALEVVDNLGLVLAEGGHPGWALWWMQLCERMYEQLAQPLFKIRALWAKGRLYATLGQWEPAAQCLDRVCRAWRDREMSYDAALAALDLAAVWLERGRPEEVKALAREMYPVFVAQDIPREAAAALTLFSRAAEEERVTRDLLLRVVRKVKARPPRREYQRPTAAPD